MDEELKINILFEDDDLLVIDKPIGVVVNNAKTVKGATIQSWMSKRLTADGVQFDDLENTHWAQSWKELVPVDFDDQYGSPKETFVQRQGLVHRLDKDTSGVLLLAKNPGSLVNLLAQFKQRQVKKEYLALVHGRVEPDRGELNFPIGRSKQRLKMAVVSDGRAASTEYLVEDLIALDQDWLKRVTDHAGLDSQKLLKQMKNSYSQGFSKVRCFPKTGRMHQIRVHMAHVKHPVVGDKLYAGRKRVRFDQLWSKTHQLIAGKISFAHPRSGDEVVVESEFDLVTFL